MVITSKRGNLDNVATFEHICDTKEDMNNIDPYQITIGSICIVIKGEDDGLEVYIADSDKIWHPIISGSGEDSSSSNLNSIIIKFKDIISEENYNSIINNRDLKTLSNNEKMEIINLLIESAGEEDVWKDFIKTKYLVDSHIYYGYYIENKDSDAARIAEKGLVKEIFLPDNYTAISIGAFSSKDLSSYDTSNIEVIHGKNIKNINGNAFYNCTNLKTIDFPNLNVVESSAFSNSSIEGIIKVGINNEESIAGKIDLNAFSSCPNIEGLEANVSLINAYAFVNCQGLKYIFLKGATQIKGGAFVACSNLEYAYIEEGTFTQYNNTYTIITSPKLKYLYLGPEINNIPNNLFSGSSINCKVQCGFSEGAISGFPENAGFAGPIEQLDIEYNIPIEEALKPEDILTE